MGLADDFERRLEQVVEGFFSKAFRSKLEPAEIGRRMLREMEGGKMVSVGAVYVPNRYRVQLSPRDHSRFEGLAPELQKKFSDILKDAARERRWRLPGPIVIEFLEEPSVKEGKFRLDAAHDAKAEAQSRLGQARARLELVDGDAAQEWILDGDEMTVGRHEGCDIVIPDPQVSRRHARLTWREDAWWITDLGALNSTLVNGGLVKERRLQPGDRIRVGLTELEYREDAAGG